jgi:hypothetical protein
LNGGLRFLIDFPVRTELLMCPNFARVLPEALGACSIAAFCKVSTPLENIAASAASPVADQQHLHHRPKTASRREVRKAIPAFVATPAGFMRSNDANVRAQMAAAIPSPGLAQTLQHRKPTPN